MFRIIAYIIGFLLFASVFRWVMALFKGLLSDNSPSPASRGTGAAPGGASSAASQGQTASSKPVVAGELRRCPVCGTYSATSLIKSGKGGEMLYFCSAECQSKHVVV